jgi:hypothetical protein
VAHRGTANTLNVVAIKSGEIPTADLFILDIHHPLFEDQSGGISVRREQPASRIDYTVLTPGMVVSGLRKLVSLFPFP